MTTHPAPNGTHPEPTLWQRIRRTWFDVPADSTPEPEPEPTPAPLADAPRQRRPPAGWRTTSRPSPWWPRPKTCRKERAWDTR